MTRLGQPVVHSWFVGPAEHSLPDASPLFLIVLYDLCWRALVVELVPPRVGECLRLNTQHYGRRLCVLDLNGRAVPMESLSTWLADGVRYLEFERM